MQSQVGATLTFKPRPSSGWLWLAAIGAIPLLLSLAILLPFSGLLPISVILLNLGPTSLIAIPFLALAAWFPTMRYELADETLTLRYGPVLRYRIPLAEVQDVRRRNLSISLVSSMRLPGLALFTVSYADVGRVKMCATSAAERILLIKTPKATYGVTPADEEGFVAALKARLES